MLFIGDDVDGLSLLFFEDQITGEFRAGSAEHVEIEYTPSNDLAEG